MLATLTYKPGYKFDAEFRSVAGNDYTMISIESELPMADKCSELGRVYRAEFIPVGERMSDDDLKAFIHKLVVLFENHEVNEWLKFDGEYHTQPHPELVKT